MKNIYRISVIFLLFAYQVNAQNNIILNFSAVNNVQPVSLDQIWIKNVTKGCDTTLPQGVTTINLGLVGINEHLDVLCDHIWIFEISSNPFIGHTEFGVFIPDNGLLHSTILDVNGRNFMNLNKQVKKGIHYFRVTAANQGLYILTVTSGTSSATLKLISLETIDQPSKLEYTGSKEEIGIKLKNTSGRGFQFTPGDELILVGYSGGLESGTIKKPNSAQTIIFQFAKGIPCPGLPSVTYEEKIYNTVQIMSQCWLKENIDLGNQINGTVPQSDNQVIEKYCFNDDANNCTLYGGLYQWSEMMKYISDEISTQGICPGDWHIANDLEWMVLEGTADSQYGIGDPFWWHDGNRGFDAGRNLKSTTGWKDNGSGTDLYGFTALPGGIHHDDNTYIGLTKYGCFWTSSRSISVFASTARTLDYYYNLVYRDAYERTEARSVRCIKNY